MLAVSVSVVGMFIGYIIARYQRSVQTLLLGESTVMSPDDYVYVGLLICSVAVGPLIRYLNDYRLKQLVSSALGFAIVVSVCREHFVHSLVTSLVNCLIIKSIRPRFCHVASFLWCFGYIAFFRMTHLFGLPSPPPHANAVQLLLTLKMTGLAFEISDSLRNRAEYKAQSSKSADTNQVLKCEYQHIAPGVADMMLYAYCYIGILTGPYYKYRTYCDMLRQDAEKDFGVKSVLVQRLKFFPLYAVSFLVASSYFSINYVRTDAFYDEPFWFRLFYMTPMFYIFRMRFYVAWILAECMCITAGLGAYPAASKPRCGEGPTNFEALKEAELSSGCEYDFQTIRTINVYGCEFATTVQEGMRCWNMTVQYWLARNVYKRLPLRSAPLKVAITMMTSAFWHGFHAGYYLSFIFVPACLAVEAVAVAPLLGRAPSDRRRRAFRALNWFCRMRAFDYMCMGFLLLGMRATLRYWASVYFCAHVAAAVAFLACTVATRLTRTHAEKTVKVK